MGFTGELGSEESASCGSDDLRADARRNIRSILEAAARVLAEDPAASVQEIADAAAVSRPTVYRHFANREVLIEAIRQEAMAQALEAVEAAAASDRTGADALEQLILDLAGVVARYPLLATLIGKRQEPKGHKPPERLVKAFTVLIARGEGDGTLRPGLREDILGPVMMGGLITALKVGGQAGRDPREVGADVAEIVLGGVRRVPRFDRRASGPDADRSR